MKTRYLFLALLIAQTAAAFAQSRSDVRLYIPQVTADDPAHADFFRRNFSMEISAAGYTVTENIQDADYTLRLSVRRNFNMYDDGYSEPADPYEQQFMLQINLMRNSDTVQIVSLSFGFDELEEMYNHNLSLVYQTLANVPLGDGGDDRTLVKYMVGREYDGGNWWRDRWLYLRVSADYPLSYHRKIEEDNIIDPKIIAMPGATIGLEFQFLDWISLEANFELRLWDVVGFAFIPGVGAQLKFPLKNFSNWMIEPYAAGVYAVNLAEHSESFPQFSVGGGIQFGVKAGNLGGILFFDANYMHSLSEVVTRNFDSTSNWNRFVIGLSVGIKIGFINRGSQSSDPDTWLF